MAFSLLHSTPTQVILRPPDKHKEDAKQGLRGKSIERAGSRAASIEEVAKKRMGHASLCGLAIVVAW